METNPTRNHEVVGLIHGLAQWVEDQALPWARGHWYSLDPALLWLWYRPAGIALIWPLAWEPAYSMGAALKSKKKRVAYRDVVAYQLDWLDIPHLFTDSIYHFSMSYWWAFNSGLVEQNKVRKSWWKVINNFVNVFTACQSNILFMQHWFQYILCHHMRICWDLFHLIWRNLFQTVVSNLPDDWQFYFKTLLPLHLE